MAKKLQKPYYYVTVFKIEGHSTFRAVLSMGEDDFKKQVLNATKVTELKTYRIDKVTGDIDVR